jgi:hypothetical protein
VLGHISWDLYQWIEPCWSVVRSRAQRFVNDFWNSGFQSHTPEPIWPKGFKPGLVQSMATLLATGKPLKGQELAPA